MKRFKMTIFFLVFALIIIILILFSNRQSTTINILPSKNAVDIYANFIFDTRNSQTKPACSPYRSNFKQYSVFIDNIEYPRSPLPLYMNKSIDFDCLNEKIQVERRSKPVILFWNEIGMFGGKQLTNECPIKHCELTHDKTRLYESDLVVSHMVDKIEAMPVNYARPWHQRWIFFLLESPVHSLNYEKYNGVFNLSATYKRDTDFGVGVSFNFNWG